MKYQIVIIPMPTNQQLVQQAINTAVGSKTLISTTVFSGPYDGNNGLMLMIVYS
jgi:hypothetical protein